MAIDFEADITAMLDADEFASIATFTPAKYPHPSATKTVSINVVYDNEYVEVGGVAGYKPTALGSTAAFEAGDIGVDAKATIKGVNYRVVEPQPDGIGLTLMVLQRI